MGNDERPSGGGNGWNEYQRLVLSELERHEDRLKELGDQLRRIDSEIVMLKVKSGVWGAAAGALPVLFAFLLKWILSAGRP